MKNRRLVWLMIASLALTSTGCIKKSSENTETITTTTEAAQDSNEDEEARSAHDCVIEAISDSFALGGNGIGYRFPEGISGYTYKKVYTDRDWSDNGTVFEPSNKKDTLIFTWSGPAEVGEHAYEIERKDISDNMSISLRNQDETQQLIAQYEMELPGGLWDAVNSLGKKDFTATGPYVEKGYYKVERDDTVLRVIFEVQEDAFKGYQVIYADKELELLHYYTYMEREDIYDDARVREVLDSCRPAVLQ